MKVNGKPNWILFISSALFARWGIKSVPISKAKLNTPIIECFIFKFIEATKL
jgi:hypothetical protein